MTYLLIAVAGTVSFVLYVAVMVAAARRVLGVHVGTIRPVFASFLAWSVVGAISQSIPAPPPGQEYKYLLFVIPFLGGTLVLAIAVLLILVGFRPGGNGFAVLTAWGSVRG